MNTQEIMQIALDLVGFDEIPGDSAIHVPGDNIKKVLIGIDIKTPELIMAKQMGYDLVIAHHPCGGTSTTRYHEVLWKHKDLLIKNGVPEKAAHDAVAPFVYKHIVDNHKSNYDHVPSVAKLLNIPFMNIHNPCDELGRKIIQDKIDEEIKDDWTLQDVVNCLNEMPEFSKAIIDVEIRMGSAEDKAGKVVLAHGAGTNGGCEVAKTYFDHGVDTVIYIHISPGDLEMLRDRSHGNLIISGHIPSDAVGIHPLIKELENKGLEVTAISGLGYV